MTLFGDCLEPERIVKYLPNGRKESYQSNYTDKQTVCIAAYHYHDKNKNHDIIRNFRCTRMIDKRLYGRLPLVGIWRIKK